jgi:Flp pilus assembly protein TadD
MNSEAIEQTLRAASGHHHARRFAEAEALYRQVLAAEPNHPHALHLLGAIAGQCGHLDAAIGLISRAIAINPRIAAAHGNLGNALMGQGRLDEAIAEYQIAIELDPTHAQTYSNLGIALHDSGRSAEAVAAHREAIRLKHDHPEAFNNLGIALLGLNQIEDAIAAYRKALELRPGYAKAFSNLGNALKRIGHVDEAIAACREAVQLDPNDADAWCNLGAALVDHHQMDEALAAHHQALRIDPHFAVAHYNIGSLLLLQGDMARGWPEYEWRWRTKDFPGPRRAFAKPMWDGSDPHGKTLLVHAEQGHGDAIQFVRYSRVLAERGARVIVECPAAVAKLCERADGVAQVVRRGEPIPEFDLHCPMMSLPLRFQTTIQTIPATVPYLSLDAADVQRWRQRLGESAGGHLTVGVAWAGSPLHFLDRLRSMLLADLAPLGSVSGVRFYSLQFNEPKPPEYNETVLDLIDWSGEFRDFGSAGLIANLDLIVTVDTAIAHLAGALARPTWVMLPFTPDWRWLLGRHDSPWYPTMKLFRQTRHRDWHGVVHRVRDQLESMAAARR